MIWCFPTPSAGCSTTTGSTSLQGCATRAGLRSLKFPELRHSFGTMAARVAPLNDVKAWLGHADIATTMVYLHYAPQPEVAAKLGALVGEQLADVTTLREVC